MYLINLLDNNINTFLTQFHLQTFIFVFQVQAPKAGRVVFGTSQERETFPEHVPFNRFAVNCASITGVPHIGPGTYENEEVNFLSGVK